MQIIQNNYSDTRFLEIDWRKLIIQNIVDVQEINPTTLNIEIDGDTHTARLKLTNLY